MEKKKVLLPITLVGDLGVVPAELTGCFNLLLWQRRRCCFKALGVE